jgi:hypothetical protein
MSTLSDAIYRHLWPDGSIPLKVARNLQAIDGRIKEIERLAAGHLPLGMERRILDPVLSAQITKQIIKLRESTEPPMKWRDIARLIGHNQTSDSVRARYIAAKERAKAEEGYAVLSGQAVLGRVYTTPTKLAAEIKAERRIHEEIIKTEPASQEFIPHDHSGGQAIDKQDHIPEVTKMDPLPALSSQVIGSMDHVGEVNKLIRSPVEPLTDEEVDQVILKRAGKSARAIAAELRKAGKEISTNGVRERQASMWARKKDPTPEKIEPPAAPKILVTLSEPRAPKKEHLLGPNCTRREIDEAIWALWNREGKTPDEISDILDEMGYSYGTQMVVRRLQQQGADL